MQKTPYRIAGDPARRLMTISFDPEFWSHDVADRFRGDCLSAAAAIGCPPDRMLVLVDLRNAVLQSQDIHEKMQALVGKTASRIALVAALPLARMQTKRLQVRENVILFADLPGAEAWLFDEVRAAA